MKKIFLIFLCLAFNFLIFNFSKSYASGTDMLSMISKRLNELMPFWTNMQTCKKYEKSRLSNDGSYYFHYRILGIENNRCHVIVPEFMPDDCYFPLEVSKKIATMQIKSYKEALFKIKYKHQYSSYDAAATTDYIDSMTKKYCKYYNYK